VCTNDQHIAVDRDLKGSSISFITCRPCQGGASSDDAFPVADSTQSSVWTCKPCPHFAMTYKNGRCECPFPDWSLAGNTCVRSVDINDLEVNQYKLSEAQQITYNSVIKENGDLTSQTVT
jgi:hypothetical protein